MYGTFTIKIYIGTRVADPRCLSRNQQQEQKRGGKN
jgi:hypothetical protein